MGELRRLLEAAKKYDWEGEKSKCEVEGEQRNLASCAAGPLNGGRGATRPTGGALGDRPLPAGAGPRIEEGGSVDRCSTSTFNLNLLSGPVLPTICEMYEKGSWRVAHGLKKIFAAANITTSVKLEGRRADSKRTWGEDGDGASRVEDVIIAA